LDPSTVAVPRMEATTPAYLADTDGDFLADVIEWAVLTNSTRPDTDADGISDFVEVVQFGTPLHAGLPSAQDHEMRTVVTVEDDPFLGEIVWMHFLFRFMGVGGQSVQLDPWIELMGARVPFGLQFGSQNVFLEQRVDPYEGHFAVLSTRLADRATLQSLLPCTFGADARIGTRTLRVGTHTFDLDGQFSHLVPIGAPGPNGGGFAVQQSGAPQEDSNPFANSNKLCVMQLRRVGTAPGGILFETRDPNCEEASGLECSVKCPQAEGWTITLPDGLGPLTGN